VRKANRVKRGTGFQNDRGATLVESAVVMSIILIPLILAILEFGLLFKDWLTVSNATRDAVQVSAAAANDPVADIAALRAIETGMSGTPLDQIQQVRIGNADSGASTVYAYTPASMCTWTPCPDPDLPGLYVQPNWAPVDRDVEVGNLDRVEITITFQHNYVTGIMGSSIDLTQSVTNRLEPQVFSP
jgi:hypothetical protein